MKKIGYLSAGLLGAAFLLGCASLPLHHGETTSGHHAEGVSCTVEGCSDLTHNSGCVYECPSDSHDHDCVYSCVNPEHDHSCTAGTAAVLTGSGAGGHHSSGSHHSGSHQHCCG